MSPHLHSKTHTPRPAGRSILVVGSANMDLVVSVGRHPKPGETLFGDTFGMFPGGKGANQAVCCAKLGTDVRFIGKIGRDVFGGALVRSLEKEGVHLEGLLEDPKSPTGTALITVDADGQNEIIVVSGSNMELTPRDLLKHRHLFESAAIVLVQLEIPVGTVEAALRQAKKRKAVTILNPAPACALAPELLALSDFITPNETELEILTGRSVRTVADAESASACLLEAGARNVIVTLGSEGCVWVTNEGACRVPARRVRVVDTTAAGDAFNGGFACALLKGWDVPASLRFARDVAACAVMKMGAQASMPTARRVKQLQASGT